MPVTTGIIGYDVILPFISPSTPPILDCALITRICRLAIGSFAFVAFGSRPPEAETLPSGESADGQLEPNAA